MPPVLTPHWSLLLCKSARGGGPLYQHYGNNVVNSAYVLFFPRHLCNDNDGGQDCLSSRGVRSFFSVLRDSDIKLFRRLTHLKPHIFLYK